MSSLAERVPPTSPTELVLVLASSLSATLEELSTSPLSSLPEKDNQPPVPENYWIKLLTLTIIEEVRVSTIMNDLSEDLVGNEGARGSDDSGNLDSGMELRDVETCIFSVFSAN